MTDVPRMLPGLVALAKSIDTIAGEVYDAEAWTIERWGYLGVLVSNEDEHLALPWAAIVKITLEEDT